MRVLYTYAGGSGHADPLVPLADAVRTAGHAVAFAGGRSGADVPKAHGFRVFAPPGAAPVPSPPIAPLRPIDMAHEYEVLRDFYAGREARERASLVLELCARWKPTSSSATRSTSAA